ncbi:hypothetical protein L3Q82_023745 [Scortum barcoo]|uniref:Uncharacterized protein n=1 Tax=Scortum barcoo TaxID=214431 RepID=A0ACB8WU91_9TELE|nr:hypothetical protein L3Q82_023745 [Scortum barcoo]
MFSASIVDAAVRSCGRKVSGACRGGNPEPMVVDTGSKGCLSGLKKESYRTMLACGTPDAQLTGTGRPSKPQPMDGPGGKNSGHCRTVEEYLHFEDLLNPTTDLPSNEEAEDGDSEVEDSSITQAEVTEVVRKLLGGKAPGVDEIRPEYLKSLDVVGLSWLTRLCNIAWRLGTVPLEWQTGVVVPLFKKGDRRVCSKLQRDHTSQPPREGLRQGTGEENSADSRPSDSGGTMRFSSWSWNSGPALYPPCRVLRGFMGVCPTSPHVLCGSGEGIRPCPSWYSVGSAPRVWGPGPLLRAVRSLYDRSRSLVRIAGSKSDLFPVHVGLRQGCPLSPVLFIIFMDRISRRSQGPEGVRFGNHRISSLLFADDVVLLASSSQDLQHVLERFAAECEAAGMRISTSKSEAMVTRPEKGGVPSPGGVEKVLPQVEEFKYLGVLFTSEGKMEREIDRRIGAASAVECGYAVGVPRTVVVKKELSQKRSSRFTGQSTFPPHLWS